LPYPLSTDPVRVAGDIEQLANKIDTILEEEIQDVAANIWIGGTFTNGLNAPTYNDMTGKMSMSLAQDLQTTASPQFVGLTLTGDIDVQGGDITTNQTTFNLVNTTATTLNIGGAATTVAIGNSAGVINSAADINVATGKEYKINNVSVLNATTLGSSVVSSSLTSVGTVTTGTWSATAIAADKGGTGQTSYVIGDLLYASSSSTLAKLAGVATGNVLVSGGTETAPSWGKVGLDTHISGTLGVANGGTGATTSTGTGSVVLSDSPTFTGTVSLGDNITFLSSVTGSPSSNASIVVNRGTSDDVAIRWNETDDQWEYTNDGTTYEAIGSGTGDGGSANLQDVLLFAGM